MSAPGESIDQRRAHLAAQIARQRGDLAHAYRNLHHPIEMGEKGLQAFGFLRQNTWIFVALPATLKLASFFLGLRGGAKPAKEVPRPRVSKEIERPKGILGHAVKWGGHGFRLFKVYRRVRKFFP